jgi:hypothetical protein
MALVFYIQHFNWESTLSRPASKCGLVGGVVKFGRRANFPWKNEDFFLKARIDRHCKMV